MRQCLSLAFLLLAGITSAAEQVIVFAAASTADALNVIATAHEAATGVRVVCSFAASSTLAKQIEQGAPADVFLSADQRWMDTLATANHIQTATRRDLFANRLVLITPKERPLAVRVEAGFAIADAFAGRIAIADPTNVPAGTYARQAFTALGWWAALEPRLAPAADVRAALRLVELGECALGVVYASDAAASAHVVTAAVIPESLHAPIRYPVALTAEAKPAAAAFMARLASADAAAVFAKHGFNVSAAHDVGPASRERVRVLTPEEWSILALSLQVALGSLLLLAVPGIALGWVLARCSFPGRTLLDVLVHLPLVLPPVVTGYLLLLLLGRRGPIGGWLHDLGIDIAFTWKGAALAAAAMSLPLLVRAVRLAIELSDRRLEDAARTLGASPLRVLFTITLPLATPGIIAGLVLAFARSLGEFGATITLAGNIPGESRTLPVAIYALTQTPGGDDAALRLVVISLVLSLAALAGSEWLNRRWSRAAGRVAA